MKTLQINDIFPLETIPDNSIYLFVSLVLTGGVLLALSLYFFYKRYHSPQIDAEKKQLIILKNCNFDNTKQSAYQVSYYGRRLASRQEEKEAIETLITKLHTYKYKKEPSVIPQEIKDELQSFIQLIESRNA